ncbi:hypothetical protein AK51_29455 [Serratia nematodiphila DZ0503SBS1]|nr:hypothetical protein AK51_29455 [Serratia nematodiphila DZ0503SBS1]
MLNNALLDSGKRAAVFGSVAVIRESGVNSLRVGDVYYVGHLRGGSGCGMPSPPTLFCWRCSRWCWW